MIQIFYRNNWKGFLSRLVLCNCSIEVICYAIVANQIQFEKLKGLQKSIFNASGSNSAKKHTQRRPYVFVFVFVTLYLKQRRHKRS